MTNKGDNAMPRNQTESLLQANSSSHKPQAANDGGVEAALAAARPRLLRFARRQGVAPDAADDVVQETLMEAWRHLHRLHTPQGIDAWLTSICRHVCLRWARAQGVSAARQMSLSTATQPQEAEDLLEMELADP